MRISDWSSDVCSSDLRFDPDDLLKDIHVYDAAGAYVCSAPVLEAVGFLDDDAAKIRARQDADWRKATKKAAELEQLLSTDELAALSIEYADEVQTPEPTIIRPVRPRGRSMGALAIKSEPETTGQIAFIDHFAAAVERQHLRVVE